MYFLVSRSEVVYVGKSKDLRYRVREHRNDYVSYRFFAEKIYTEAYSMDCGLDSLDDLEKAFIITLKPYYNFVHRRRQPSGGEILWARRTLAASGIRTVINMRVSLHSD